MRINENNGPKLHYGFRGLIKHLMAADWSPFESAARISTKKFQRTSFRSLPARLRKKTDLLEIGLYGNTSTRAKDDRF